MRSPLAGSPAMQTAGSGSASGGPAGVAGSGGNSGGGGGAGNSQQKERERVLMLRERDGEAYRAALAAANARSGHSVSRLYTARLSAAGGGGAQTNVPEELIQQVLTVLQGKSRQLIVRELQRCVRSFFSFSFSFPFLLVLVLQHVLHVTVHVQYVNCECIVHVRQVYRCSPFCSFRCHTTVCHAIDTTDTCASFCLNASTVYILRILYTVQCTLSTVLCITVQCACICMCRTSTLIWPSTIC